MCSEMVLGGNASYSATKVMVSNFGESVYYELQANVDVTAWDPGFIYSNIHLNPPPSLMTKSTKSAVSDILT